MSMAAGNSLRTMRRLPLATRPPLRPYHSVSSSFSVPQRWAACCCSLKQACASARSGRSLPPPTAFAGAAATATNLGAAPLLATALLLAAAASPALPADVPPAFAEPVPEGAALFRKACIGCHDMGGNILQPGATLFLKDLERYGVATEEEIYNITYYGKGRMPVCFSIFSHDPPFHPWKALERNAPREGNVRLDPGYPKMISSC